MIGTARATPMTVEPAAMARLSSMPSVISAPRPVKLGCANAETKRQPRSRPSATRAQLTCTEPRASVR